MDSKGGASCLPAVNPGPVKTGGGWRVLDAHTPLRSEGNTATGRLDTNLRDRLAPTNYLQISKTSDGGFASYLTLFLVFEMLMSGKKKKKTRLFSFSGEYREPQNPRTPSCRPRVLLVLSGAQCPWERVAWPREKLVTPEA